MKSLLAISMAFALFLMPFAVYGQSKQTTTKAPPVSQTLVPEGDFALKLVTALNLGTATTEVQAEDMLTSVGIAPKNGWIADYPMTLMIIGEVQSAHGGSSSFGGSGSGHSFSGFSGGHASGGFSGGGHGGGGGRR